MSNPFDTAGVTVALWTPSIQYGGINSINNKDTDPKIGLVGGKLNFKQLVLY